MSNHLRDDNECQNCGRTVEEVYCTRCGQKNTETRQSFGQLVAHFAEDLTHYDGAFWRTIKFLLFRPAYLTKQYLEGKRQAYVPPVKLYIFISFVSFLLPALIPVAERDEEFYLENHERPKPDITIKEGNRNALMGWEDKVGYYIESPIGYRTLKEMDSIETIKPDSLKLSPEEYKHVADIVQRYETKTPYEVGDILTAKIPSTLSKAIFIYMPLFAFWLWVFHSKKRWFFFDHGIFTLHYFSFLMITTSVIITILKAYLYLHSNALGYFGLFFTILVWAYQIYYFYKAHKRMYNESVTLNFIKSSALFLINIGIMILMVGVLIYQSYNMLL